MWVVLSMPALAQNLENPDLQAQEDPSAVPNATPIAVRGWDYGDAAHGVAVDVAAAGVPIDCAALLVASPNGGHFARATGGVDSQNESISTLLTHLVVGVRYRVQFEASIVRHFGQSWGRWQVAFGAQVADADALELPTTDQAQQEWVVQSVEFVADSEAATLRFTAVSFGDGVTGSEALVGEEPCPYFSVPTATDLLIDGIRVIPDVDGDGAFDHTDLCPGHPNPDPLDADGDGLPDAVELTIGTDPCAIDTDGDGLTDGDELADGCDPFDEDSDDDGLYSDAEEVAEGTDCRDVRDPPIAFRPACEAGCDPEKSGTGSASVFLPLAFGLWRRGSRRRPPC